jgi:hypothetical protein
MLVLLMGVLEEWEETHTVNADVLAEHFLVFFNVTGGCLFNGLKY